jgi:signal transduction histidine kinase
MVQKAQQTPGRKHPPPKSFEEFRLLTHQIMQLAMRGLLRIDFLREAARILMEFSECDTVEMWLKERGRYYRGEVNRSRKPQFRFEIMPTEEKEGLISPRVNDRHLLGRLCRDIMLRRTDAFLPFMTPGGGFLTGNISSTLQQVFDNEIEAEDSGRFLQAWQFRSLAVIPISIEEEDLGLLQLKSKTSDFLSRNDVEFYESLIQTLGLALIHRRTQVELRERIKELTCLFGIAKLVEDSGLTLSGILQGIVELLPPAWLYPDVASARIILDGNSYVTNPFRESDFRQTVDLIVEGDKRGTIEVNYSEAKPELDEGPFLLEERRLIDTISREVALIVERKHTEGEKARLQDQLRHADRLATIGQLSAGVAHELNEPIGSILGFAQLIEKNPRLPEQVEQDAVKIMKASLHAREVIKKLMLFARQMPPQKTRVDLNQIVDEGLYFLESRCAKEGIQMEKKLAGFLPKIHADPAQMTQVLVNVVVNAIQAMSGGGKLTIQTRASKKAVSLTIRDTGTGMDENIKKQVFLPFFTTKDIGEGTGLGLAVVHGIVSSHGGSIDVTSELGKGTTFEVILPTAEPRNSKE